MSHLQIKPAQWIVCEMQSRGKVKVMNTLTYSERKKLRVKGYVYTHSLFLSSSTHIAMSHVGRECVS